MGIMTYIKLGAFMVLIGALWGAKAYFDWSQNEIKVLQGNNIKLELAIEQSEAAIESLQNGIKKSHKAHDTVSRKFAKSRQDNTRLKDLLGKHDLGFLASKKPGMIQKRTNIGTSNANRCFEIVSGSPLTASERNATKPSEINSSCPDLANPRYRP